jgi:hypothetical protein
LILIDLAGWVERQQNPSFGGAGPMMSFAQPLPMQRRGLALADRAPKILWPTHGTPISSKIKIEFPKSSRRYLEHLLIC